MSNLSSIPGAHASMHRVSQFIVPTALLWAGLAAASHQPAVPRQNRAPGPDTIRAEIFELRSDKGTVYCSIYAAPGDGFPTDGGKARKAVSSKILGGKALCAFDGFAPGVYAVAMIHDENDNHKLDTNWIGLPTEGYGASRDAKGTFGPPRFKDAAFTYGGGSVRVPIRVRY